MRYIRIKIFGTLGIETEHMAFKQSLNSSIFLSLLGRSSECLKINVALRLYDEEIYKYITRYMLSQI